MANKTTSIKREIAKRETATTPTPHIAAKKGQIAKTVLLPGNPARAEWVAQTFLKNPKLVTNVRGICGYTGTYNGNPVTIMASGMGGPSVGIYVYELYNFYGVENIIRIGTCGGLQKNIKPGDLVIAMTASTDSSFASQYGLDGIIAPCADYGLLQKANEFALKNKIKVHTGMVFTSQYFSAYNPQQTWKEWAKIGALGQEMETYALYCNALAAGKKALSILTTTINLHTRAESKEAPECLLPMVRTALSLV